MAEEDVKKFIGDLCSEISYKDLLKTWGKNLVTLIPSVSQYFAANMSSFEHEIQLRGIKKLVDAQGELKSLLEERFDEFFNVVRKYERTIYPYKIFTISQIEDIQGELNWNPEFIKEYLPLPEIENLPLDTHVLLKGKIGIGKTRTIFRLIERMNIDTIIVVTEYVKTLGVERFENLDFPEKAMLIWDDVQKTHEEFVKALPFLKTKENLIIIAAIRSPDYERIEKDFTMREGNFFTEIDLVLYQKERMERFVMLCEKEFHRPLTDEIREALVEKALIGDATPLYVASIFQKEKHITKEVIKELPEDVVDLWTTYYKDLSSNEQCFMKALKAAQIGFTPPYKELIEQLYSKAFFGEKRDLSDIVSSLIGKNWIVKIPGYYVCLDVQLECFNLEDIDMDNFNTCLLEKELPLDYHPQLLLGVGSVYYKAKNFDHLIILMNRALELRPDYAEALYNRGNTYYKKGEYDQAIQDYDAALELRPDDAEALYNRGTAYSKKGEYDRAIQDYDAALELRPDYAEALYNRGTVYSDKGEYDRAIQDYDAVLKLRPDYAEALYNKGTVYSKKGEYDRAIEDYEKCAITFFRKGIILNALLIFIQIFMLNKKTKNQKNLCSECGLLAIFLINKVKETIDFSEVLNYFHYQCLRDLLNDVNQYKNNLKSSYSKFLLYKLNIHLIDKNTKISEFLSEEEIKFLEGINKKDINDLFEKITVEREQLIFRAFLDVL